MKFVILYKLNISLFFGFGLFFTNAFADNGNEVFQDVVSTYHVANPKPVFPEVARKYKVQAEFATQEKRFDQAIRSYSKTL